MVERDTGALRDWEGDVVPLTLLLALGLTAELRDAEAGTDCERFPDKEMRGVREGWRVSEATWEADTNPEGVCVELSSVRVARGDGEA